ncbi:DNA-binding response regulator [Serratia sp. MYb239]|nr:DNA-binding response regulator [Serratia sp. MYb239]
MNKDVLMDTWLVVDDHPAICFAVKTMLAQLGDNVIITANSGTDALAKIKEHRPGMVILDIMLNKMDGLQVLQRIRQLNSAIKVIVYTGLPAENYAERAMRAGARGFFHKDQDISQLVPLCQLVLQGYACFPYDAVTPLFNTAERNSNALARLSDRELTVLRYLSEGLSNKDIADRLLLSNKTISTYKSRLIEKFNGKSLEEVYALLNEQGSTENNG